MNILTVTSLYPNAEQPVHGVFVENRLRHLVASGAVNLRVIAPVPWFPFPGAMFGQYGVYAKVPKTETRHGISVTHPRFPVIPKIGMNITPRLMYWALKPVLAKMLAEGIKCDLIDAHYFYPDGVAAAMLGQAFNIPVVITSRGTDINLIPQHETPRRQILWAADKAAGMITVSAALKQRLVELGAAETKITMLRNGVDLQTFHMMERTKCRARFNLQGTTLLSVGNLVPLKGHDLVIRALKNLPDFQLVIAGDGPERARLESLTGDLELKNRIQFLGRIPHEDLPSLYSAGDALMLASSREGWPNVLLESMACGTPAIATDVGGVSEIVTEPASGLVVGTRTPEALTTAVRQLFEHLPDRAATRAYAEGFSWDATTQGQLDLFHSIIDA
ncbi:MAG: glycosyltransferase family 4 protein [Rhodospirillaceae bacterium]|nr:glycosyltransferase family 4 protein [Rhodospirillaceae bacterium]